MGVLEDTAHSAGVPLLGLIGLQKHRLNSLFNITLRQKKIKHSRRFIWPRRLVEALSFGVMHGLVRKHICLSDTLVFIVSCHQTWTLAAFREAPRERKKSRGCLSRNLRWWE